MHEHAYPITLTPGGFPDLLSNPASPRTVADLTSHQVSVIDLAHSKRACDIHHRDDEDTLLDEILDDSVGEEPEAVDHYRETSRALKCRSTVSMAEKQKNSSFHKYQADSNRRSMYYEEEKKEDDRVETLRNEFDRQVFASIEPEEEESVYDSEEDEESGDEEEDDSSVRSGNSATTVDLLERAHDRLHMQHLHDEIDHLKEVIERKNVELENLTGQLRRAVATKCDLVLAHTELELHHEHNLKKREKGLKELGKINRELLEEQSLVEVQLLNEIAILTNRMREQEEAHKKELHAVEQQHSTAITNRERLHINEVKLKNSQIAKLQEEIRVLKGGSPDSASEKKGGLLSFIPLPKQ